ncbi:translation initiation factor IF-5A [Candidatus Micrarchaeota archaeon]|nr:translation initiation factor IF-5A [Candidatus Micrarchaeota archaeon]
MSEKVFASAKDLKVGKYVLIEGNPCRIVSIDKSKPGKHGSAKLRIVATDIFTRQKKNLLTNTGSDVEVPIIERKTAQVLSVSGNSAQVMDPQSYETFEILLPDEIQGEVNAGDEVEVMEAMGKRTILRKR